MTHSHQQSLLGERRGDQRHRTLKPAKIVFNRKTSVIDCAARNLSAHGARLQVANTAGIPDQFGLVIDGVSRPAKSVWKTNNEIGIKFLDGAAEG